MKIIKKRILALVKYICFLLDYHPYQWYDYGIYLVEKHKAKKQFWKEWNGEETGDEFLKGLMGKDNAN